MSILTLFLVAILNVLAPGGAAGSRAQQSMSNGGPILRAQPDDIVGGYPTLTGGGVVQPNDIVGGNPTHSP